jgi:hypothetical protein
MRCLRTFVIRGFDTTRDHKDASPNFQAQNGLLSLHSWWRSVRSLGNWEGHSETVAFPLRDRGLAVKKTSVCLLLRRVSMPGGLLHRHHQETSSTNQGIDRRGRDAFLYFLL